MRWFAAVVVVLVCLASIGPALAHASLIGSSPPNGAILETSPPAIELTFSEPVSPLAANLVQPDGNTLKLDTFLVKGRSLVMGLPSPASIGTRILSWRAVSADGHPISGALVFSIGTTSAVAPPLPASDHLVAIGLWLARAITFLALFIGVGGTAFVMIGVPQPKASRTASILLITCGIPATIASIGLQGLDALGLSLPALATPETWSVGFSTAYGATTAVQVLAMFLGAAALVSRQPRLTAGLSALAISAAAFAICLSGHASAAEPQWLSRTALFTHIVSIAWWVGALFPLALLLKQERPISAPPLIRFSRFIPFAIAPLVASGLILAVMQMGWPGASWSTPYGAILAAKLALLTVLFRRGELEPLGFDRARRPRRGRRPHAHAPCHPSRSSPYRGHTRLGLRMEVHSAAAGSGCRGGGPARTRHRAAGKKRHRRRCCDYPGASRQCCPPDRPSRR